MRPLSRVSVTGLAAQSASSSDLPLNATERRVFRGNKQDRRQAGARAPVEGDVSLPQRREYVAQELSFTRTSCQEDYFSD
jgi:hypothetical protein